MTRALSHHASHVSHPWRALRDGRKDLVSVCPVMHLNLCVVPELVSLSIYQSVDVVQLDTLPVKYGHIGTTAGA